MSADKVVLAGYLVRCPLGGYAWQVLHYLVGLRSLGLDPYFYEDTAYYSDCFDPVSGNMHVAPDAGVAFAADFFERCGFADRWVFWDSQRDRYHGLHRETCETLLHEARLLITLAAVNHVPRVPRQSRVFIDIDPGFTQIRVSEGDQALRELLDDHDLHFTIGENIGTAACSIPVERYHWRPTRQPVAIELWGGPESRGAGERGSRGAGVNLSSPPTPLHPSSPAPLHPSSPAPLPPGPPAWTTIGRWDERQRDVTVGGERYAWNKRAEWLKFLDLPARTGEPFLVAMDVHKTPADADLLMRHGWQIADPIAVSRDAFVYRDFIQRSKGEFTVAKDLNVRLSTGWFSDRSACYLAAGRPVITQSTGFERHLPVGLGLFAIKDVLQAAAAVAAVTADYESHARAGRNVAIERFDAPRVITKLLAAL